MVEQRGDCENGEHDDHYAPELAGHHAQSHRAVVHHRGPRRSGSGGRRASFGRHLPDEARPASVHADVVDHRRRAGGTPGRRGGNVPILPGIDAPGEV